MNIEERGKYLGEFEADDKILVVQKSGILQLINFDLSRHFNDDILLIEKWQKEIPLTAVYFDNAKDCYYVKRFYAVNNDKATSIISESKGSFLEIITSNPSAELHISFVKERGKERKEEKIMNNHLKNILEFRSKVDNEILKNKLKKLNLHIFVTSFATEYFFADKDKNIVETIGNTPLIDISEISPNSVKIFAKLATMPYCISS